jgi:hypothetical protein
MPKPLKGTEERFEQAVREVAAITAALLDDLPERRTPAPTLPPLRRLASTGSASAAPGARQARAQG